MANASNISEVVSASTLEWLDGVIQQRLFGPGPWIAGQEADQIIRNKLVELGLWSRGMGPVGENTPLGESINLDFMVALMGYGSTFAVGYLLAHYEIITDEQACLFSSAENDEDDKKDEQCLKAIAVWAQARFYQRPGKVLIHPPAWRKNFR